MDTNTPDPIGIFPGDATPDEIRAAVETLRLFAAHDGPDDWERVALTARWIAEAADWQIRDAKEQATAGRCQAAHPEDPTPCDGPPVVTVLDADNHGANACEHHGARLLASLEGGRVYALPDAPEGAAIRVFKAADTTRPFAWYENAPRTRPESLSSAENRAAAAGLVFDVEESGADSDGWDPDDPYGDVERYERDNG